MSSSSFYRGSRRAGICQFCQMGFEGWSWWCHSRACCLVSAFWNPIHLFSKECYFLLFLFCWFTTLYSQCLHGPPQRCTRYFSFKIVKSPDSLTIYWKFHPVSLHTDRPIWPSISCWHLGSWKLMILLAESSAPQRSPLLQYPSGRHYCLNQLICWAYLALWSACSLYPARASWCSCVTPFRFIRFFETLLLTFGESFAGWASSKGAGCWRDASANRVRGWAQVSRLSLFGPQGCFRNCMSYLPPWGLMTTFNSWTETCFCVYENLFYGDASAYDGPSSCYFCTQFIF